MILPNLIYIATPYSHPEHYMRVARFIAVNNVAGKLMAEGKYVFSPISHTHPIAEMRSLPVEWKYWEGYDRCMMAACDLVLVLRLPGWETSTGVQAEIKIANEHSLPVEYIDYDLTPTLDEIISIAKAQESLEDTVSKSYDPSGICIETSTV